MRTVDLGRTAAQAEFLRYKLILKRQVRRGLWAVVAALFGIAVLVMVHVVLFQGIALLIPPLWASVAVLAFDAVMLLIFGIVASSSKPSLVETEAAVLRDQALIEMRESMAIGALLSPVGRVAIKAAGRGAWSAFSPGRVKRKSK